ncbi:thioredoxin family protein [Terriglobus roseus]|uniref:Thioredoxin-like n=1 Tax=Terriglobus roseus TaxID=392734 RepID=A0A1H4Q4K0_9BACT|nr:thioredoxin family protein [Terriglobus roseus]SEC14545.1 Thioredoxin-like [Terriglobus roseus]
MRFPGVSFVKQSALTAVFTAAVAFSVTGCKQQAPEATPTVSTTPATPAKVKPPVVTTPPAVKAHLYDDDADPNKLIAAGLKQAKKEHKRVILDFGGDWCGDCQVLDIYMHRQPNWDLLNNNFVVVHISVGHIDKNLEIGERYGVALSKGVPALAVLDANGKALYAQAGGEFESMRYMQESSVTEFLNKWKA